MYYSVTQAIKGICLKLVTNRSHALTLGWLLFVGCWILSGQVVNAAVSDQPVTDQQIDLNRDYQQLFESATDLQHKGYGKQALPLFNKALLLSQQLPQARQLESLFSLARVHDELGLYGVALGYLDRILNQLTAVNVDARIDALNLSATIYSRLNDKNKAQEFFLLAEEAAEGAGPFINATVLANRIRYEMDFANRSVLAELLEKSWIISQQLADSLQAAEVRVSLAALYLRATTEFRQDARWLERALEILTIAGDTAARELEHRVLSYALGYKGQILLETGEIEAALSWLQAASFYANDSLAYESAYLWEWQLARANVQLGQTSLAIQQYYRAIQTLEPVRQALIDGSPFTFHQKIQPLFTQLSSLLLDVARRSEGNERQSYLKQVQVVLEQAKSAELQDYFQNECVIPDKALDLEKIEPATAVLYPVLFTLRQSEIVAQANVGDGGNILLVADNFIADTETLISASSQQGIDGLVSIESPNQAVNPTSADLNTGFQDLSEFISRRCSTEKLEGRSYLVVENMNPIHQNPNDYLTLSPTLSRSSAALDPEVQQWQAGC